MNRYHIRLDSLDMKSIKEIILKGESRVLIGMEDKKGNPHTHMYIESELQSGSFRKRILLMPDYTKGNRYYSVKVLVDQGDSFMKMKGYVMKDGKTESVGFSEEELLTISEYNENVKREIKEKVKKKKTKVLDLMIEEFKLGEKKCLPRVEEIVELVIDYYIHTGTLIRKFMMVSQIQTLCLKYNALGYRRMLKQDLMNSLTPFNV